MSVFVPVSWGEVIDKITILEIKSERIKDSTKLANVNKELEQLCAVRDKFFPDHTPLKELALELKRVNEVLWDVEDDIRNCERARDFGETFVRLARAVYVTNDQRADWKRRINDLLGSDLVEEKSYAPYQA